MATKNYTLYAHYCKLLFDAYRLDLHHLWYPQNNRSWFIFISLKTPSFKKAFHCCWILWNGKDWWTFPKCGIERTGNWITVYSLESIAKMNLEMTVTSNYHHSLLSCKYHSLLDLIHCNIHIFHCLLCPSSVLIWKLCNLCKPTTNLSHTKFLSVTSSTFSFLNFAGNRHSPFLVTRVPIFGANFLVSVAICTALEQCAKKYTI